MTVTLNSAGGASVPNWSLVSSNTPTGVSTYTFSGLGGYSKYRILIPTIKCATSTDTLSVRFNSDSGNNYAYGYSAIFPSAPYLDSASSVGTGISIGNIDTTLNSMLQLDVDNALLSAPKFISGIHNSELNAINKQITAQYITSSALTSITVFTSIGHNFTSGTIYLFGAN